MRNAVFVLALVGGMSVGTAVQADGPPNQQPTVQPIYWSGDYCGPRCREHRWWRHHRWEARRHGWHHRQWEGRRYYGYYPYPRY
jgi:hypothetical protein